MPALTSEQERLMRHALGDPARGKRTYRNRFATMLGGTTGQEWQALAAKGLAEHYHTEPSGMMFFAVTDAGCARIGVLPEKD